MSLKKFRDVCLVVVKAAATKCMCVFDEHRLLCCLEKEGMYHFVYFYECLEMDCKSKQRRLMITTETVRDINMRTLYAAVNCEMNGSADSVVLPRPGSKPVL